VVKRTGHVARIGEMKKKYVQYFSQGTSRKQSTWKA